MNQMQTPEGRLLEQFMEMHSELKELRAWKESMMAVEREWDAQCIARMLGAKLGESCRAVIHRRVPEILRENDKLGEELEAWQTAFEDFGLEPETARAAVDKQLNPPKVKRRPTEKFL